MKKKTITAILVNPGEEPVVKEVLDDLEALQKEVGGHIEATYPFEDPVGIIMNEEGKIMDLPLNRALYTEDGEIYDIIAGGFLIVGLGEYNFVSLTEAQIEKYRKVFERPQRFIRINGTILAIPA